jgi:hypothetical protein
VFTVCGALSSFIYAPDSVRGWVLFPLPFSLLSAFLCLKRRIPLFVVLCIGVWNAAYWTTYFMYSDARAVPSFFTGGLIGGSGLAASAGWFDRRLVTAALIGGIAGLAFLLPTKDTSTLALPFAIWQGAVGTYFFAISRKA